MHLKMRQMEGTVLEGNVPIDTLVRITEKACGRKCRDRTLSGYRDFTAKVIAEAGTEELYRTLPITTEHEKYWNPATRELFQRFDAMGLNPKPTPKFLKNPACANCGHCAIGCPTRIKWDTREMVDEAVRRASMMRGCRRISMSRTRRSSRSRRGCRRSSRSWRSQ